MILGVSVSLMKVQCVTQILVQYGQIGVTGQSVVLVVGEECR